MKTQGAAEVARAFVHERVFTYDAPIPLLTENGGTFTAKHFQDVCNILNVHNALPKTHHPQTNVHVERYNRTILAALRHYIADHPRDWNLYCRTLTFSYNTTPLTITGYVPFDLVLSKPTKPPVLRREPSIERTAREIGVHGSKRPFMSPEVA